MNVRCGVLRTSRVVVGASPSPVESAAEALVTLVQSCYPSASVVFPCGFGEGRQSRGASGDLEVLQVRLQSKLAARGELPGEFGAAGRVLARRWWATAAPSTRLRPRWWEVVARLSPPSNVHSSLFANNLNVPPLCPDAVVYIDGVEVIDVANMVAPQLMEDIPNIVAVDNVGSGTSTHGGERQEPTYCRRKVNWERYWQVKRCAMRGADLMELSLPISAPSAMGDRSFSRASLLVAVANPNVSLSTLHRQKNSSRRGPLRTAFGYSLPCLRNALPVAVVRSVRLLRAWQQRVLQSSAGAGGGAAAPSTSAFWVSAVGHLLDTPLESKLKHPVLQVIEDWLEASPEKTMLTAVHTELLRTLTQPDVSVEDLPLCGEQHEGDFLSSLLFSAMVQRALATPPSEWNSTNYFLPRERFDGTTDMAAATALSHCCGGVAASFSQSTSEELLRHSTGRWQ
ncbi:putative mitochondrial hypothetical protein [Leptomonas pyrrhocoris]|uniref:Uncharacterized protein n=1 Tax=Leptomonas pyrrhocoris TaxID=157538 RepID=A0A0M9G2F4_LEPPY|nr:putative mitochondrial hypothetical protein [Leptomonas pyrrhocoris]KPA80873.1 putative mitochondrial hypothetical protein [Leptomonas pyrrhocoris]|eukprot:XP_015659312.1 putative mitochondrial hypothetical protein [Leptomonas pyrrhocoris]